MLLMTWYPLLSLELFLGSASWTEHSGQALRDPRIKMDRASKGYRFHILHKSDGQVTRLLSFQAN